jgi:hypothetical protein
MHRIKLIQRIQQVIAHRTIVLYKSFATQPHRSTPQRDGGDAEGLPHIRQGIRRKKIEE